MSMVHSQALINASPNQVWELVGDPRRHPEWWPRVIEVRGERYNEGDNYAQVTREPLGSMETIMNVERLEEVRQINLRCTKTGTYARWLLTEAQGNTFVDVEFGMEPIRLVDRVMDATIARPYFQRWINQSLEALEEAAAEPVPSRPV
jgi:ribosome-associated toxin RatA of RatAB toxin-antitoxin module